MRRRKAASLQGGKAARVAQAKGLVLLLVAGLLVDGGPRSQAYSLADLQARSLAGASPHRIISLIPSVTEMLFAIGAGDAVVGVSTFDHYPHDVETRTKVGGLLDPDFERVLSLRPDLVVVYGTQSGLIERLGRAQIPMFNYEHAGLADVTRTLRQVGARVGRAEAANRLALDIEKRLTDVRARIGGRAKPKTMIVFEREPGTLRGMFASGGVGFLHDMLETAGGADVFADVRRQSVQVTSELALARAPEVILEIRTGPEWTPARAARERDSWRALASVPAVRTGRVYLLNDEVLSIPGPRVPDAVRQIAGVLHPEVFK
jgi:iron complex transport system substrate-binding protein